MSYALVRGIKIQEEAGKVLLKAASNNVSPRNYDWFESNSLSRILKEEGRVAVEKKILRAYWDGQFQPGTENLYSRAVSFYRSRLPYTWDNTGNVVGEEKYGCLIQYTYAELEDALHEKFLSFKYRDTSARYCLRYRVAYYIRKCTGRYIFYTESMAAAKQFRSYEDAWVCAVRAGLDPEEVLVKL